MGCGLVPGIVTLNRLGSSPVVKVAGSELQPEPRLSGKTCDLHPQEGTSTDLGRTHSRVP